MRKFLCSFLLLCLVCAGCSYPQTQVMTTDERPRLQFTNAPKGAVVYLDGLLIGPADQYAGKPDVLMVEPGTHEVRVLSAQNAELVNQVIFVDGELKIINVR